jgi:hypothetical protein
MNLYFKIWVDTILKNKKKSFAKRRLECMVQISMAIAMALNLMFLLGILQRNILHLSFMTSKSNLFTVKILNNLLSGFILFYRLY